MQKPRNAKGKAPNRIKLSGRTVLTGRNARTNAGQRIQTRVTGGPVKPSTQGQVRYFRVIRKAKGKVVLRTYGRPGLKIVLVHKAPATAKYKKFKERSVYVNGRKR